MSRLTSDPLLSVSRAIVAFLMAVMGIAAVATLTAAPVVAIFSSRIASGIAAETGRTVPPETVPIIVGILLLASLLLAMVFLALRHLRRIVDTVAKGDPFVPENAARLTRMAWLMLGVQVVQAPIYALGAWIESLVDAGSGDADIDVALNIDLSALILVLILFVLARVFAKGAQMRDDLEGTV